MLNKQEGLGNLKVIIQQEDFYHNYKPSPCFIQVVYMDKSLKRTKIFSPIFKMSFLEPLTLIANKFRPEWEMFENTKYQSAFTITNKIYISLDNIKKPKYLIGQLEDDLQVIQGYNFFKHGIFLVIIVCMLGIFIIKRSRKVFQDQQSL